MRFRGAPKSVDLGLANTINNPPLERQKTRRTQTCSSVAPPLSTLLSLVAKPTTPSVSSYPEAPAALFPPQSAEATGTDGRAQAHTTYTHTSMATMAAESSPTGPSSSSGGGSSSSSTERLPMPSRNPLPLSASQEAQVREIFYEKVRSQCGPEIKGTFSPGIRSPLKGPNHHLLCP